MNIQNMKVSDISPYENSLNKKSVNNIELKSKIDIIADILPPIQSGSNTAYRLFFLIHILPYLHYNTI